MAKANSSDSYLKLSKSIEYNKRLRNSTSNYSRFTQSSLAY